MRDISQRFFPAAASMEMLSAMERSRFSCQKSFDSKAAAVL